MLTFFEHFDYSSQQHEWFGIGTFFLGTPPRNNLDLFSNILMVWEHFLGKQVYETIHANLKGTEHFRIFLLTF